MLEGHTELWVSCAIDRCSVHHSPVLVKRMKNALIAIEGKGHPTSSSLLDNIDVGCTHAPALQFQLDQPQVNILGSVEVLCLSPEGDVTGNGTD